jgi:hypothetical protein
MRTWGCRGSKLLLPLAMAGTLLLLPGTSLLAQEADIPETGELTDPTEEVVTEGGDQTGIDLDQLTREELSKLCRTRPDLVAAEECRKLLGQASSVGAPASGGNGPASVTLTTRTSTQGDHVAAPRRGTTRGQSTAGRPQIAVRKTNDADGNGRFTESEVAPRAGADVPFRITIRNDGQSAVTIREIIDSFDGTTIDVCGALIGDQLRPGRTTRCTFELADYAPPSFDSQANTIEVTVTARGGARASDSAISAVTTIPGDEAEVGGTTERNPGAGGDSGRAGGSGNFASTGSYVARLLGLATALILTGAIMVRAGRRRPDEEGVPARAALLARSPA